VSLFYAFNILAFILLVLFLIALGVGFAQGILRQVIGMAALYIALVLGAQYYSPFSTWLQSTLFLQKTSLLSAISFFIIVVVVWIIVTGLAFDAYRATKLNLFPLIDQLGGAILAVITLTVALAFILPVIKLMVSEPWVSIENVRQMLNAAITGSRLVPELIGLRPLLLNSLTPLLPYGIPSIFTFQ
jgi:uncharacterized membrane protein required for colicin V production